MIGQWEKLFTPSTPFLMTPSSGESTRLAQALFWGEYGETFNVERSGVLEEGVKINRDKTRIYEVKASESGLDFLVVRVHLRQWMEELQASAVRCGGFQALNTKAISKLLMMISKAARAGRNASRSRAPVNLLGVLAWPARRRTHHDPKWARSVKVTLRIIWHRILRAIWHRQFRTHSIYQSTVTG